MGQVSDYVEAPFQGVSQAPHPVRLITQVESMDDSYVAIPDGWQKRPPFDYKASLAAGVDWQSNVVFEPIERAAGNTAMLLSREGGSTVLRVYETDTWTAQTMNISAAAQTYLDDSVVNPNAEMRVLTVADTTFIVNRNVVVTATSSKSDTRPFEAIIWVRASAFAREYEIIVNKKVSGTPVTTKYLTPDGSAAGHARWVDTDLVTEILDIGPPSSIPGGGSSSGTLAALAAQGFTVIREGSVLYISHPTDDFTVDTKDGQAGLAMTAVKDRIQNFSDLPKKAHLGFVVRIVQSSSGDEDDFYVKYDETAGVGTGVWQETIAPDTFLGVDPITLPIQMQFNPSTSEWDVDTAAWEQRTVGDEDLAPDPNFIGETIEDLSFWNGRLVMLYDEYSLLTAANNPWGLYPTTLSSVLDSDSFEMTSPYETTSVFRYAIPFDKRLIIFSDLAQFEITSDGVTSPTSTSINVTSQYRSAAQIKPQAANDKVYFMSDRGKRFSTVFELSVDNITNTDQAEDLGIAIPRYIPIGIDRAAVNPTEYIAVYAKSGESELFVHVFRYAEQRRVQNAWSRWHLPTGWTLGGMFFIGTQLHVLAIEATAVGNDRAHIGVADLTPGLLDAQDTATILTHLDWRLINPASGEVYDDVNDRTAITLPYAAQSNMQLVVRADDIDGPGTGGKPFGGTDLPTVYEGVVANYDSNDGDTIRYEGDWTDASYWVGFQYSAEAQASTLYVRREGGTPNRTGRLSIRKLLFDITRTGYLRFEVDIKGRPIFSREWNGGRYGDAASQYNEPLLDTTIFSVPIQSENEQYTMKWINDSPFGSRVTGYTWIGEFNPKAGSR